MVDLTNKNAKVSYQTKSNIASAPPPVADLVCNFKLCPKLLGSVEKLLFAEISVF